MSGKHRRIAEVPFDEVRDAATSLGYPVDSVVLEHPDDLAELDAPLAGDGTAVESAPVLPVPPGSRRTRLESRRQARRNRLIVVGVVIALIVSALGWSLLRGGDDVPVSGPVAAAGRSQTTLLMQVVDSRHQAVLSALLAHDTSAGGNGYAVLIPGSLVVNVAGVGNASLAQTATYSGSNGPALAVADALDVIVDGSWTLTTAGLAALVDAAGGVQVTVDTQVLRAGKAGSGDAIVLNPGAQKLDGVLAATYATYLGDGEPEAKRLARFADVLREALAGLPAGAAEHAAAITALGAGSTATMPFGRIGSVLDGLRTDISSDNLTVQNLPTRTLDGGDNAAVVVDPTAVADLVKSGFSASIPAKRANGAIRVLVQNGVGTPGLGEFARTKLVKDALTYINGGNAGTFGYQTSIVLIADVSVESRAQGKAVADALGLPQSSLQVAAQGQSLADVIVVLGEDFKP